MQIKKASMASLKARKPWRHAAARNRKGSCITLQLVILLPNQVGSRTSAQEVWHGRRDKRRNHAALTKTGHKSHDGVVNKDDDHRKAKAHTGSCPLTLNTKRHADESKEEAGKGHGKAAVDFHDVFARWLVLPLQDTNVHLQFTDGHFIRVFLIKGDGLWRFRNGKDLLIKGHGPREPFLVCDFRDGSLFHDPRPILPFGFRRALDADDAALIPILDGDVLHDASFFIKGPSISKTRQLALGNIFQQDMVCLLYTSDAADE